MSSKENAIDTVDRLKELVDAIHEDYEIPKLVRNLLQSELRYLTNQINNIRDEQGKNSSTDCGGRQGTSEARGSNDSSEGVKEKEEES